MPLRLNRAGALVACLVAALFVSSCKLIQTGDDASCPEPGPLEQTLLAHEPTMKSLAHDLDKVEKHIEWYGSVVPKVPDVWGQARLTKHREEFEDVMATDLHGFEVKLNGAVTRADSACFAQAVALSAAIQPGPRTSIFGSRMLSDTTNVTNQPTTLNGPIVEVQSDEGEGAHVRVAVHADVEALHEAMSAWKLSGWSKPVPAPVPTMRVLATRPTKSVIWDGLLPDMGG
jgi:hypothetical protein